MKKYWLMIVLSLVAVAMGVIKLNYQLRITNYKLNENPIPTIIPTPTVSTINESDYPLWRLLPYSGVGFTVDRYIEPLTLVVAVKGLDKAIVAEEIGKWMETNGIDPETHKIVINYQ